MEAEVVRYLLKEEKGKRAVLARLVLYCAPFLKRLKISAMIWMPEELLEELETLIDEMGILCERMDQKSGKVLIFLYREETLCRYLMRESQEAFLLNCGYQKGNLKGKIRRFAERTPQVTLVWMPEAKHEIFNADGESRRKYYETIFAFLKKNGERNG